MLSIAVVCRCSSIFDFSCLGIGQRLSKFKKEQPMQLHGNFRGNGKNLMTGGGGHNIGIT